MAIPSPDLTGKAAIVTGASRGIGKAIAIALGRAGCGVTVAAKSEQSREDLPGSIHETAAAIGPNALPVRCDVRNAEDIAGMVAQTVERFGRVDYFIHNAGALWWRPLADTPLKRFDLIMDVNVRAGFAGCTEVLPHMRRQGFGHVLLIAPPIDLEALPGKTAYLISKYGLTMLMLGLAAEERGNGIGASTLWPATAVESAATVNHQMGTPEMWRKADIVSDAVLALFSAPPLQRSGQALIDEELLREHGVTDFEPYNCVPGGKPLYIWGPQATTMRWMERAGALRGK
ncbi:MAG: SDR family NAD(P)-dependent oxidoreductase [Planctomycetota bacterium]|nr:MAG: SDR family NAD(P)-dependent oxidoreductase [Planctomycetota bacterium]